MSCSRTTQCAADELFDLKLDTLPLSNCAPHTKFSDAKFITIAMTKTFVEAVQMSIQI